MTIEQQLSLAGRNAEAIAETLVHHGERMEELAEASNSLTKQIALLRIEMELQKQMIVKSLQQKYGTGPTA